jgi:hypothetical protein
MFQLQLFFCRDTSLSQELHYCSYMYPIKIVIKSTTDDARSASFLDLHLETDREGRLISHCEFTVCI